MIKKDVKIETYFSQITNSIVRIRRGHYFDKPSLRMWICEITGFGNIPSARECIINCCTVDYM